MLSEQHLMVKRGRGASQLAASAVQITARNLRTRKLGKHTFREAPDKGAILGSE